MQGKSSEDDETTAGSLPEWRWDLDDVGCVAALNEIEDDLLWLACDRRQKLYIAKASLPPAMAFWRESAQSLQSRKLEVFGSEHYPTIRRLDQLR